jgi:creatinine amidohydrolase
MNTGVCLSALLLAAAASAQNLPSKWEELTGPDFPKAIEQAKGVCLLPFGIVEKHGPSGPMGTDLLNVRYATFLATAKEYAVVFPDYYFGQIFEAKHQPGTIAYSTHLQLELLQETVAEMGRNGCKKIVIISGHGGNTNLIQFFAQTQLETPKEYVVYALMGGGNAAAPIPAAARPSKPGVDGHAGEGEIANVMAHRPDLAHPAGVYTGIWWYAKVPNHYQGNSAGATAERGKAALEVRAKGIEDAIRAIKADQVSPRLQKEFFEAAKHPLDTKQ